MIKVKHRYTGELLLEVETLEGANLGRANLEGANLYGTSITAFQYGRHFAFHHEGIVKIGCITKSLEEWLDGYIQIGKKEGYSDKQIKAYGKWLNLIKEMEND